MSTFLSLPLEVRAYIMELASQDNPQRISLLLVSRDLHMEAAPYIYNQHATFESQALFFTWLAQSHPANLLRVREMSLRLSDIDVSSRIDSSHNQPVLWDMYADELTRLCDSFRRLPNLCKLRILDPRSLHSHLFKDLVHQFLRHLPTLLPPGCSCCMPDVGSPHDVGSGGGRDVRMSGGKNSTRVKANSHFPINLLNTPSSNSAISTKSEKRPLREKDMLMKRHSETSRARLCATTDGSRSRTC